MRVLITWGSRRGGTEGIARLIGEALARDGHEPLPLEPRAAARATGYDAAIVGGALYAGRWHPAARRFLAKKEQVLRSVPVWTFSSGPLDDSAARTEIPPTPQVAILMERVGALGHVTFGGRLSPDARGFPAAAVARKRAGDWRDPERVRRWAGEIVRALPAARPGTVVPQRGRSLAYLVAHAAAGWAACAAVMGLLLATVPLTAALWLHALAAPVIFTLVARHYFRARGSREPLDVALAFTALVALLDLVLVAGVALRSVDMFRSVLGTWLPFALVFVATWATGELMAMVSASRPAARAPRRAA